MVIWLTGLSASGKTTIANALQNKLINKKINSYVLDGDNLRNGLCKDLGFSYQDRSENVRRTSEVAKILVDNGIVVIISLISPIRVERQHAQKLFMKEDFLEVFVSTPLEICIQRDPKGLYAKAIKGELLMFTGISDKYEEPLEPGLSINTNILSVDECCNLILEKIHFKLNYE